MRIVVQEAPFDLGAEANSFVGDRTDMGAIVTFTGVVRDLADGDLDVMEIEHYPGMTEKSLQKIIQQASENWDLLDICIAHRVGQVFPGEPIVCVAVWSAHRKEAYEANRMIMEHLKSSAPFWKKEQLTHEDRWVDSNTKGF